MRVLYGLLTLLLLALPAAAQPTAEVDWIDKMPGVSSSARQDSQGHLSRTYLLTGATSFQQLVDGLARRGWVVESNTNVAGAVYTLIARRQEWMLNMSLSGSDREGVLALTVSPAQEDHTVTWDPAKDRTATGEVKLGAGENPTITGNHRQLIYVCQGNLVRIYGNHNQVTLKGNFKVELMGNHNQVDCQGQIMGGSVLGNHNQLRWSGAANPGTLPLQVGGNENKVERY